VEFEVQDGRLGVRRWTRFTVSERSPYTWRLTMGVEGMAGLITLSLTAGDHAALGEDAPVPVGVGEATSTIRCYGVTTTWVPSGLHAHAYRPWPTGIDGGEPQECEYLHGGRCYCQELDGASRTESGVLVQGLAMGPSGWPTMWEALEERYVEEFCPPVDTSELERLRAYVAASERAARGDAPGCKACRHLLGKHKGEGGRCIVDGCDCREYAHEVPALEPQR
jgi:hypothetical protein